MLGNHDHGDSKAPFVRPTDPGFVESCGVRLLTNEPVTVERGGAAVQVGGVDDTDGGHDDLPAVLARLDRRPGVLRLLLTHHAAVVKETEPGDFHLTLAGDTHGGQICLPLPGRRIMLSDPGPSSPRGATTSAAAPCTSRAASAPACCRSGRSAGRRSSSSAWRPADAARASPPALADRPASSRLLRSSAPLLRRLRRLRRPVHRRCTGSPPAAVAWRSAGKGEDTYWLLLRRRQAGRVRRKRTTATELLGIAEPMGGRTDDRAVRDR